MEDTYSYTLLMHIPILKPFGDENSEHCLWLLLCSKSSMLCSIPIVILFLYIYPYENLLVMKTQSTVSDSCQFLCQSINQSINQSIDQSINRSINQSINESINQSINQCIYQCSLYLLVCIPQSSTSKLNWTMYLK